MTKNLPKKNKKNKSLNDAKKKINKLNSLPHKKKIGRQLRIFRGPLPPYEVLKGYNHLYPKSAKILIDNFQKQSEHRRHLEDIRYKNRYALAYIALIGSILIMALFLWLSYELLDNGHSIVGSIFGLTGIIGVASAMVKISYKFTSNHNNK